jgi:hypothetical protein
MRKRDLYEVALKLLGVYMIIKLIERLESTIWWMYSYLFDNDLTAIPIMLIVSNWITISIGVLVVYFLMFRTQSLINAMTKHQRVEEDDLLTDFTSRDQLYEMTLIILGSILLITNLPELIFNLSTSTFTADHRYTATGMLYISGLKALVGLLTIIYAKFVAKRLIRKPNDTLVDD